MVSNAQLRGFISTKFRPFIQIKTFSGLYINGVVDTGFNGELLMGRWEANHYSVELAGRDYDLKILGGSPVEVELGHLVLDWFGSRGTVKVAVVEVEEEVLLGTRLIHPGQLFMDFLQQTVLITKTQ